MDFDQINERFCRLRDQLKIEQGSAGYFDLSMEPKGDGTPHIEIEGNLLFFVVSERGHEDVRRSAHDTDELLYWLISSITHHHAQQSLLMRDHPKWNEREVWFREEEKMLRELNPCWGDRKRAYHDWLLHPDKRDGLPIPPDLIE